MYRSEPHITTISRSVPFSYDTGFLTDDTYPASPYYASPASEFELDYSPDEYSASFITPNMDLFDTRSYNSSPLSQMSSSGDSAYIHLPLDPSEPLFTNSPSPPADEPRTPESPGHSEEDIYVNSGTSFVFDTAYSEYPV